MSDYVIPGTVILRSIKLNTKISEGRRAIRGYRKISLPKQMDATTFSYEGTLSADTAEDLRTLRDDLLTNLREGVTINVFGNRTCFAYLFEYQNSFQWQAVSDIFIKVSFTLKNTDGIFTSTTILDTTEYKTP